MDKFAANEDEDGFVYKDSDPSSDRINIRTEWMQETVSLTPDGVKQLILTLRDFITEDVWEGLIDD